MKMFKPMSQKMEEDSFEAFLLGEKLDYKVKSDGMNPTLCVYCRHFNGYLSDGKPYCKAFPGGIPSKFWDAKVDHTTPYTGDNGITFEP